MEVLVTLAQVKIRWKYISGTIKVRNKYG